MKSIVKLIVVFFLPFANFFSYAQYKISYVVKESSRRHTIDHLFIAGSFNSWDPADKKFEFAEDNTGTAEVLFHCLAEIMNINLHEEVLVQS